MKATSSSSIGSLETTTMILPSAGARWFSMRGRRSSHNRPRLLLLALTSFAAASGAKRQNLQSGAGELPEPRLEAAVEQYGAGGTGPAPTDTLKVIARCENGDGIVEIAKRNTWRQHDADDRAPRFGRGSCSVCR